MEDSEIPDPESIHYVVTPNGAEHEIDFERPLFLIEIVYSNNVTQHVVNADSPREARDAALIKAASEGEKVLTAQRYIVAAMEEMPPGGKNGA